MTHSWFVFCRELVLVVVVVVLEVDLELPHHSEQIIKIIVNSMKNKHH